MGKITQNLARILKNIRAFFMPCKVSSSPMVNKTSHFLAGQFNFQVELIKELHGIREELIKLQEAIYDTRK